MIEKSRETVVYLEEIVGITTKRVALGGLVVSVLATGPEVRGFDLDRGRWIFKGDKNPEHLFLRRGKKPSFPSHRFTTCKITLRA
jgi:hypothetical protein